MKLKNKRGLVPRSFSEVGFSLFEMLVVIMIFGILGTLTTQIIMLSLRSANKSESLVKVREDLNNTLAVMEREIRGASKIISCDDNVVSYTNSQNNPGSFSCLGVDGDWYVAKGTDRMTGNDIKVTACSISCTTGSSDGPPSVTVNLTAHNTNKSGIESANMDTSTQIYLRNY